jgi:hypothetical protein
VSEVALSSARVRRPDRESVVMREVFAILERVSPPT